MVEAGCQTEDPYYDEDVPVCILETAEVEV